MVKLVNLTAHPINILVGDEEIILEPSANPVRCFEKRRVVQLLDLGDGVLVPLNRTKFEEPVNLPPRRDGVYYIVSRQVAEAAPDRDDLIFPDQIVYGQGGEKLGCRAFAQKEEQ